MQQHYPLNPATGFEDPTQLPWINGNPSTGADGSFPPFALCNEPMYEIVNDIEQAGLEPTSADLTQLYKAILALIANAVDKIAAPTIPTYTGQQGVQIADDVASLNFPGLPAQTTIQPADFFALYSASLPGHYKVPFSTLASLLQPQAEAIGGGETTACFYAEVGVFSWQVPAGVTLIKRLYLWGGGGGGGSSSGEAGSAYGGGGGGFASAVNLPVQPGQTITIVVGAGGAAGTNGASGGNGGTSSFANLVSATGGAGGINDQSGSTVSGGLGGQGAGNYINLTGTPGGVPFAAGYEGFEPVGGCGGGSPGGGDSTFINTNAAGAGGNFPGGGAAGGSVGIQGGLGSGGAVAFEY